MRTLVLSVMTALMGSAPYAFAQDALQRNQAQPEAEKTYTTTDGKTVRGSLVNEGSTDIQLRESNGHILLLRKTANDRVRVVTSSGDWPSYNGSPSGNRYTALNQITKNNVGRLAPAWVFSLGNVNLVENTPVVVDGVMYVSSANEIWALDAGTGRQVWHYRRPRTQGIGGNAAQGFNRGVAVEGNRVFLLTDNAHLLALSKSNGELLWETPMADSKENYNGTSAPLVVNGLVISGTAGGDEGVRGFVAAYDAATGKEVWRFWTVPKPGQPGAEEVANTWSGANADHRSGATWMTGTYDPQLDLLYWPVGNPGPDYDGSDRQGDNLYTDSVIALEAKTGKLKWHFQFTPHDIHDWDAQEVPMLVDANWHGQPRKLLLQANRNGFFYVLDRVTGEFLLGKTFLKKMNWASGLDAKGRPILKEPEMLNGNPYVCPGFQGGANWFSMSYNPGTGLFYFNALERCNIFTITKQEWQAGRAFMAGAGRPVPGESFQKFLRAIDIQTGDVKFEVPQVSRDSTASGGVISTAAGLVFYCDNTGALIAADASNGKTLWTYETNQVWKASPMSYMFDGKQHVAIAIGNTITSFAVKE